MSFRYKLFRLCFVLPFAFILCGCSGSDEVSVAETAARNGEYKKAIKLFTKLAAKYDDPGIFGNRANCYSYLGNIDAAIADYERAFALVKKRSPNGGDSILPNLHYNRGHAYDRAEKYDLAIRDYENTIALQDDYPDVKNKLAWLLATCPVAKFRNPKRAVELAKSELLRAPNSDGILDTAAACFAADGDFPLAISTQEKAIANCSDADGKSTYSARLALYRNRTPYIEPSIGK